MSILERLKEKRIFQIQTKKEFLEKWDNMEELDGKSFIITERCDEYFSEFLTQQELEQLGKEIIELASRENV